MPESDRDAVLNIIQESLVCEILTSQKSKLLWSAVGLGFHCMLLC